MAAHAPRHPIAVFHEHPNWFAPLFAELDRRGVAVSARQLGVTLVRSGGALRAVLARLQPREPVGVSARARAEPVLHAALVAPPRAARRAGRQRRGRVRTRAVQGVAAGSARGAWPPVSPRARHQRSRAGARGRRRAPLAGAGEGERRRKRGGHRALRDHRRAHGGGRQRPGRARRRWHGAGAGVRAACATGTSRASRR